MMSCWHPTHNPNFLPSWYWSVTNCYQPMSNPHSYWSWPTRSPCWWWTSRWQSWQWWPPRWQPWWSTTRLSAVQFVNLQNWGQRVWQMAILAEPASEPEVQRLGWKFFWFLFPYLAQIRSWTSGALGSHPNLSRTFNLRAQTHTKPDCRQSIHHLPKTQMMNLMMTSTGPIITNTNKTCRLI